MLSSHAPFAISKNQLLMGDWGYQITPNIKWGLVTKLFFTRNALFEVNQIKWDKPKTLKRFFYKILRFNLIMSNLHLSNLWSNARTCIISKIKGVCTVLYLLKLKKNFFCYGGASAVLSLHFIIHKVRVAMLFITRN